MVVESGNAVYDSREACNAVIHTEDNTLVAGCKASTIPGSVTAIGEFAFDGCSGLDAISIPSSVTVIDRNAFSSCVNLSSVVIPNKVEIISDNAFGNCSNLTTLTIGSGIRTIGHYAFGLCEKLSDVYCYTEEVPATSEEAFFLSPVEEATLHVPSGSIDIYKETPPWMYFGNIEGIGTGVSVSSISKPATAPAATYNLQGQHVSNNYRGIVIRNAKKYIVK